MGSILDSRCFRLQMAAWLNVHFYSNSSVKAWVLLSSVLEFIHWLQQGVKFNSINSSLNRPDLVCFS